ncbi:hypothetical protein [Chitinophaga rhizophila]|uniref:Uncharacterized protein n=1 Tax=Chitinophaga rhizophila TaxID=2866212 RepID=A0ABS7GFC4_9BACT|nr:hypothetical protein [Chitinophaga rhizophila]MBW8686388.1 hypothetical protein [Chitinophaga rhizophila]
MKLSLTRRPLMVFTIVLACTGIGLAYNHHATAKKITKKDYSGEALFAGILFMKGEVASKIPMCVDMQQILSKHPEIGESDESVTRLMNVLKQEDAHYFEHFKSVITSGDVAAIDQELVAAAKLVETKRNELQLKAISKADTRSEDLGIDLVPTRDFDLGPNGGSVREVVFSTKSNAHTGNQLHREILASQIAENFSLL